MIDKKYFSRFTLLLITMAPLLVLVVTGGHTEAALTEREKQMVDLFKWVIGGALTVQFFWIKKFMSDNEKKHDAHKAAAEKQADVHREDTKEIAKNLATVTKILYELHGEHREHLRRRSDDPGDDHGSERNS